MSHQDSSAGDGWQERLRTQTQRVLSAVEESIDAASWADPARHVAACNEAVVEAARHDLVEGIEPLPQLQPGAPIESVRSRLLAARQILLTLLEVLNRGESGGPLAPLTLEPALDRVMRLCDRFHAVAVHLRRLTRGRSPLRSIKDEYDVQSLFGALLLIDFDDVKPEEPTESDSGRSARIDFLVRPQGIGVETKMTRQGLDAGRLGDELLLDIARYRSHSACRALVCFVYDPDNRIVNAVGLERELEAHSDPAFTVRVAIRPTPRR